MINKTNKVLVPRGIRYMSDWEEFYQNFPRFPHIMDKQIPGCGFTEWCLTNPDNVVLCSPRNMLIQNKYEQHPSDVFRVKNDKYDIDPGVDKDTSRDATKSEVEEFLSSTNKQVMSVEEANTFYARLRDELRQYFNKRNTESKSYKILVTYDSFRTVKEILLEMGLLKEFQIIVDEFQSVFMDSRFKSNTELEFIDQLQDLQKVCFLSATPMLEEYLKMIPEFKDLPYYELDWSAEDPTRVMKPQLKVRIIESIYEPARKIIDSYKTGNFEEIPIRDKNGNLSKIVSTEAMFFLNSVNNIIKLIQKNKLEPEEVNILCSNTPENLKKIQTKLGKRFKIGRVPLPGEERKMFTFCTRTVYLGADFYSPCARTFILSDANVDCLAVDISLDLPQILGRQRLLENPWRNSAEFYYRTITDKNKQKMTPKKFEEKIAEKMALTHSLIRSWNDVASGEDKKNLADRYKKMASIMNYKEDYVAVNTHSITGTNMGIPVINNLVMIAEKRAFDIQQTDYADRFSVFSAIGKNITGEGDDLMNEIMEFNLEMGKIQRVGDRLKFLCEYNLSERARIILENNAEPLIQKYLVLGKDRLKALGYKVSQIKKEIEQKTFSQTALMETIYNEFHEGDKISKSDIKEQLKDIYFDLGYTKVAKATDIEEWFETKRTIINKKEGFELIKRKM